MTGTIEELFPGVYRRRHEALDLNCGIVVGSDGVAVIDTRETPTAGKDLVDAVRTVTDQPIRWVINTHWHWDHAWGNAAFSGSSIWGHTRCQEVLEAVGAAEIEAVKHWFRPERHHELDDLEVVPPTGTFDDMAFIDLGGRGLTLTFHGLAHTDADIVVGVTDAPVLYAGDIVEESAPPFFGDGYPLDWPLTLDSVIATRPEVVVPGHGDTIDLAIVEAQRSSIAAGVDIARTAHAAGIPVAEVPVSGSPFPEPTFRELVARSYLQLDADE
ncbi:MAG: MBL fold metallo-hydrolase [Acidimicrobiia bacterium]|nr:MBL fold metallo-hydrolase [Acidimicrobiia bacterium]